METWQIILILFGIGNVAGFINVMAGGGSTISLPILIFLGLDSATANGTNRVAIILQNISAIISFKKEKYAKFKISMKMAAFTIPGAILGAWLAVNLNDKIFNIILGVIMIAVVITMIIPRKKLEITKDYGDKLPWAIYPAMLGIGFYGGFIQVGVGFILMAALYYLIKLSLVNVNMHKVFIIMIYTLPALLVFMIDGKVDYLMGLSLAAGNSIGGWWAAKAQIKKGEKLVRYVLIAAIIIMSVKLLGLI